MTLVITGQLALENGNVEHWQPRSGGDLSYRIEPLGYFDELDGERWLHSRHKVTFRRNGHSMTVTYKMGMGHDGLPDAADVLRSVFEDAESVVYDSFEGWIAEYGYDPEAMARRIYNTCEAYGRKLSNLFGSSYSEWRNWALGHGEEA